jgi:membrane fusion protein (multidrug efflux system)
MKRLSKTAKIVIPVVIIAIVVGIYLFLHRGEESTDDASIEAHIVSISPKVGGYIKTLNIDDNQLVKAGDVLLEIDPADYMIRRDRALAALTAAQAGRSVSTNTLQATQISAPSNLNAAQAQVAAAEANWNKAVRDLKRFQRLSDEARSREQLDAAIAAEKTARSNLEDAKARLRSAKTVPQTIASAKSNAEAQSAQVKQAKADLAQAEKDLADTKIIAPMDGRITKKGVERGDYVQPGQQLGALVGTELWVIANYKETQLTHMVKGQKVDIHVDALPDVKIEGKIDSIQSGTGGRFSAFPPENATGNFIKIVQRVPVKIIFTKQPDVNLPLGPGISVVPTVYTR